MIPLVLLVIGVVAVLLEEQIGGQHSVGYALAALGGFLLIVQIIVTATIARRVTKAHDRFSSSFDDLWRDR